VLLNTCPCFLASRSSFDVSISVLSPLIYRIKIPTNSPHVLSEIKYRSNNLFNRDKYANKKIIESQLFMGIAKKKH
jgi:hypothetical protein